MNPKIKYETAKARTVLNTVADRKTITGDHPRRLRSLNVNSSPMQKNASANAHLFQTPINSSCPSEKMPSEVRTETKINPNTNFGKRSQITFRLGRSPGFFST